MGNSATEGRASADLVNVLFAFSAFPVVRHGFALGSIMIIDRLKTQILLLFYARLVPLKFGLAISQFDLY
jgi:hypothetical protein